MMTEMKIRCLRHERGECAAAYGVGPCSLPTYIVCPIFQREEKHRGKSTKELIDELRGRKEVYIDDGPITEITVFWDECEDKYVATRI